MIADIDQNEENIDKMLKNAEYNTIENRIWIEMLKYLYDTFKDSITYSTYLD